jgi:hypothetical protein
LEANWQQWASRAFAARPVGGAETRAGGDLFGMLTKFNQRPEKALPRELSSAHVLERVIHGALLLPRATKVAERARTGSFESAHQLIDAPHLSGLRG